MVIFPNPEGYGLYGQKNILLRARAAPHCQIEKEIRPFVACKSASSGAVNVNLGRIEFFCHPVGEEYPSMAPDEESVAGWAMFIREAC